MREFLCLGWCRPVICEADFAWSIFACTGSIDAYLMYKELQRQQDEAGAEESQGFKEGS